LFEYVQLQGFFIFFSSIEHVSSSWAFVWSGGVFPIFGKNKKFQLTTANLCPSKKIMSNV